MQVERVGEPTGGAEQAPKHGFLYFIRTVYAKEGAVGLFRGAWARVSFQFSSLIDEAKNLFIILSSTSHRYSSTRRAQQSLWQYLSLVGSGGGPVYKINSLHIICINVPHIYCSYNMC
jgi:hypothetical protein